jgi:hypothetical protein
MKLHIFYNAPDVYWQTLWSQTLDRWNSQATGVSLTEKPADADYLIDSTHANQWFDGTWLKIPPNSPFAQDPQRVFTWDISDFPSGRLRGFYASLHTSLARPDRHRGFCYNLRWNPYVTQGDPQQARFLFTFQGAITSGLRARMLDAIKPATISGRASLRVTESLWLKMLDPASNALKQEYANSIHEGKFVLCPRGNGLSSVRLFEVMESKRVPVIVSDGLLLPSHINWDSCAIRVAEKDINRIPAILSAREADWDTLAKNARQTWETHFSDAHILESLSKGITEMRSQTQHQEPEKAGRAMVRMVPWRARLAGRHALISCRNRIRKLSSRFLHHGR